jgi:hypothetical protein
MRGAPETNSTAQQTTPTSTTTGKEHSMINARIHGYLDDEGTQTIGGIITAVGGRYDDIKAVQWDDGIISDVAEHQRGINWDYDED